MNPDDPRPRFCCGNDDLNEFFHKDSIDGGKELLSVTYTLVDQGEVVAFFSLSNDSIKKAEVPKSAFKRLVRILPFNKRYSSMPAAKIGRLGIIQDKQKRGYGTNILDFLKAWFTNSNKTGCRFLLVDAYNEGKPISFYQKNGFEFLTGNDEKEDTRIMYFDLIRFRE